MLKKLALLSESGVGAPDVLIALDAPTNVLARRAAERRQRGDGELTERILDEARLRYHVWLATHESAHVVRVDTSTRGSGW